MEGDADARAFVGAHVDDEVEDVLLDELAGQGAAVLGFDGVDGVDFDVEALEGLEVALGREDVGRAGGRDLEVVAVEHEEPVFVGFELARNGSRGQGRLLGVDAVFGLDGDAEHAVVPHDVDDLQRQRRVVADGFADQRLGFRAPRRFQRVVAAVELAHPLRHERQAFPDALVLLLQRLLVLRELVGQLRQAVDVNVVALFQVRQLQVSHNLRQRLRRHAGVPLREPIVFRGGRVGAPAAAAAAAVQRHNGTPAPAHRPSHWTGAPSWLEERRRQQASAPLQRQREQELQRHRQVAA
mmetsp:Transcript_7441/g.22953  ORF Transcript_7441/g.22953 Transcript_7441/m.22953 type:complete len:297 (+) Transcript_7441:779-1669(+)